MPLKKDMCGLEKIIYEHIVRVKIATYRSLFSFLAANHLKNYNLHKPKCGNRSRVFCEDQLVWSERKVNDTE